MNRKKLESEDTESSSEEEAEEVEEDEEKGEEESASESSDDDEFDSADERVNIVPSETPSETLKLFAQGAEEDEEEAEEEEAAMKPAESEKIEGIRHFDSDVESEYETESSSESEGLTQKPMVKESSIEAVEALPFTQKKVKKDDISVNQGIAEDDYAGKKGKDKALKQQQDPKPAKTNEEGNPPAKKGQGAVKQMLKDNEQSQSAKDEKKAGHSAKKRKPESSQLDGETDSADSVPISKRRKDVDAAQNGKAGADGDKLAHTLSDTGKEIARKTLSDPSAKPNASKDVSNNKVSTVDRVPMQEKKANTDSSKGPASPQKEKKLPHVWSIEEEIMMASEVLNRVKTGLEVPSKRNDDFWLTLSELLHGKLGIEFSRDQLSEKLRRMKQRYQSVAEKIKESRELQKPFKFKKSNERNLFDICSQIWGRAEVTSLDDHEAAKEPSKPLEVAKEGKNSTKVAKFRPASKGKASKEDVVATTENSIGRDALPLDRITTMPMELDKGKEDHAKDGPSSLPDESAVLSKDVHKLLQDKIHTTLHELQEWSKNSMEAWMNKALAQIDNNLKTLGDQARRMNGMGIAGVGLPMRLCDSMEFPFVHGEEAFQQKWYELHLQELNIYAQRLELMQKECRLKQEQLKLQLQRERGK